MNFQVDLQTIVVFRHKPIVFEVQVVKINYQDMNLYKFRRQDTILFVSLLHKIKATSSRYITESLQSSYYIQFLKQIIFGFSYSLCCLFCILPISVQYLPLININQLIFILLESPLMVWQTVHFLLRYFNM